MKQSIKMIPFPEIPNAYIVISGYGTDSPNEVKSNISFCYAKDNIAIEWEPNYGPITVIYECTKDHSDAQPFWFFPYCTGYGNWSQLAVNENDLGKKFYTGDYKALFEALKNWHKAA